MRKREGLDPDLEAVERIYEALDGEDPEQALLVAEEALAGGAADDPVVHFLAGLALIEMDEAERAVGMLRRAVELDPDDPDMRANLALGLYLCCRFVEAAPEAARALGIDDLSPDAHHVTALLLERRGRLEEAEVHFARASALDPERFEKPIRLSTEEFAGEVVRAGELLDERLRALLDQVVVTVEQLPTDAVLHDESPPHPPDLFGLFVGVPRTKGSSFTGGGELPPRILLFQRNLERCFPQREELGRQIAVTLFHELGHYVGKDEEGLGELNLL